MVSEVGLVPEVGVIPEVREVSEMEVVLARGGGGFQDTNVPRKKIITSQPTS